MTVRRLAEDHWSALRDTRLAALRASPDVFGSSIDREVGFAEKHWRMRLRSAAWFVAGQDGDLEGLVCGISEPGAPLDYRHLVSMWVRPDRRRQGIGGQLVAAVVDWATNDGAAVLSLWLVDDNLAGAAFYRRSGFDPTDVSMALPRDPSRTENRWVRHLID